MSNKNKTLAKKLTPDSTASANRAMPKLARQLLWLAAALILVSGIAVAVTLQYSKVQAHQTGEALNRSLARIVQEQTDRTLQNVDLHLQLAQANLQEMRAGKMLTEGSARAMLR